jgi:hypothetical protein
LEIKFYPSSKEVEDFLDLPKSSKLLIPDWYKKSPAFDQNNLTFDSKQEVSNFTLKSCPAFLDSLMSGYIQSTWCDIYIEKNDDGSIHWRTPEGLPIISTRNKVSVPINQSYLDAEFVWLRPWIPITPDGYSVLVTHPLNRVDLPFTTLSGVLDTDSGHSVPWGKIPFYLNKDFSGLIPAGTPMFQITPFKREDWTVSAEKFNQKHMDKKIFERNQKFWNFYKDFFWKRKNYN